MRWIYNERDFSTQCPLNFRKNGVGKIICIATPECLRCHNFIDIPDVGHLNCRANRNLCVDILGNPL
jgi:hypothetical protein